MIMLLLSMIALLFIMWIGLVVFLKVLSGVLSVLSAFAVGIQRIK